MLNYHSYICTRAKIEEYIRWRSKYYLIRTYECDNKFTPGEEASIQCYGQAEFDYVCAVNIKMDKYDPEVSREFTHARDARFFTQMRRYENPDIMGKSNASEIIQNLLREDNLNDPKDLMDRLDTKYNYGKIEKFLGECFCEK